jgi:hypothetical protein
VRFEIGSRRASIFGGDRFQRVTTREPYPYRLRYCRLSLGISVSRADRENHLSIGSGLEIEVIVRSVGNVLLTPEVLFGR